MLCFLCSKLGFAPVIRLKAYKDLIFLVMYQRQILYTSSIECSDETV